MSELLNKYIEQHDEFIALLVKYYTLHENFVERQSPRRTGDLRKIYKEMRIVLRNMEITAQERMKERRIEWGKVNRVKKDNNNE
jgi:hypothetical protein